MGRKEKELDKQIEFNGGYEELRRNLDVFEELKKIKQSKRKKGREEWGINYQQFKKRRKEEGDISGRW